jgi:hypothetical protein
MIEKSRPKKRDFFRPLAMSSASFIAAMVSALCISRHSRISHSSRARAQQQTQGNVKRHGIVHSAVFSPKTS